MDVDLQQLHDHAFHIGLLESKIGVAKDAQSEVFGMDWHMSYGLTCQFFPIALIPVNMAADNVLDKLGKAYHRTGEEIHETALTYNRVDRNIELHMKQLGAEMAKIALGNELVDPKSQVSPHDNMMPGPGDLGSGNFSWLNPLTSGQAGNWTSGLSIVNDAHLLVRQLTDENKRNLGLLQGQAAGIGLSSMSLTTDPVGVLASSGAAWAMEHIKPLKAMLDGLSGNPDMIKGAARTWDNISRHLDGLGEQYHGLVGKETNLWTGEAADGYRQKTATNLLDATMTAGRLAKGMSVVVGVTGEMVTTVRGFVRDIIASLVADLVKAGLKRLIGWSGGPVEELGKIARMTKLAKTMVAKLISMFGDAKSVVSRVLDMYNMVSRIIPLLNGI